MDATSSLCVTSLPIFCGEEQLSVLFSTFGPLVQVKVWKVDEGATALISYHTNQAAQAARSRMNGQIVMGKRIKVDWAVKKPSSPAINSIYVRFAAIKFEPITYKMLHPFFARFGVVSEISIKDSTVDPRTGRQSGLAFVHYDSTPQGLQSALQAISVMDGMSVEGIHFKAEPSRNLIKQFNQDHQQMPQSPVEIDHFNRVSPRYDNFPAPSVPFYGHGVPYQMPMPNSMPPYAPPPLVMTMGRDSHHTAPYYVPSPRMVQMNPNVSHLHIPDPSMKYYQGRGYSQQSFMVQNQLQSKTITPPSHYCTPRGYVTPSSTRSIGNYSVGSAYSSATTSDACTVSTTPSMSPCVRAENLDVETQEKEAERLSFLCHLESNSFDADESANDPSIRPSMHGL
eukprot:gene4747-5202_t